MNDQQATRLMEIAEDLAAHDRAIDGHFIPTRYPYTYACDYLRTHQKVVPEAIRSAWKAEAPPSWSRADASAVRQHWAKADGLDDAALAEVLALQYMRENGIEKDVAQIDKLMGRTS